MLDGNSPGEDFPGGNLIEENSSGGNFPSIENFVLLYLFIVILQLPEIYLLCMVINVDTRFNEL